MVPFLKFISDNADSKFIAIIALMFVIWWLISLLKDCNQTISEFKTTITESQNKVRETLGGLKGFIEGALK